MDLKKYLPTEEMMVEFEKYRKLTTDQEKSTFIAQREDKYLQKTQEEKDLVKEKTFEGICNINDRIEELTDIVRLGEVSKVVSLSYISEKYFGKKRQWLYQRLNGNMVNGKPAKFTSDERKKLADALQDISKKIHEASLKIA